MKNKNRMILIELTIIFTVLMTSVISCSSQDGSAVQKEEGGLSLIVTAGEEWLHDFEIFLGFKRKNPPQYAIWIEDTDGNYLETIAVTEKLAKEKWIFNGGNRRVEALPLWSHRHGKIYSDGLLLPSADEPLPDEITAASAKGSPEFGFGFEGVEEWPRVRTFAEFNHSTDFNDTWPSGALPGSSGYSGGEYGSGQPAVVYSAVFFPRDLQPGDSIELQLAGRSSADGSDGQLYTDLAGMTSALNIVSSVKLVLNKK